MPHIPTENEPSLWHKYFAMEFNNRTWALSIQNRTPEEDREMLNVAHASAHHWHAMGIELNRMRAQMTLAEVHALLGLGESALSYAKEMLAFFLSIDSPDWEVAFAHTIYAHAVLASGDRATYETAINQAEISLNDIADDQDREIVKKTFDIVTQSAAQNN